MELHQLLGRLAAFGTLETGRGPRHPTAPNPALASEIDLFLETFPFLRRDAGYVEFLESYSGLLLSRESDFLSLSIYGFDPSVGLHLTEGEGAVVSEDGFLTFADVAVPVEEGRFSPGDPVGAAFAFDATGKRLDGVYRCSSDGPYEWHCRSFEGFLELLVSQGGRWS